MDAAAVNWMPPTTVPAVVMLSGVLLRVSNVAVGGRAVGAVPVLQLAPVSKAVPVPPIQVWADAPTGDRQVPANNNAASRRGRRFTLTCAISPKSSPNHSTLRVVSNVVVTSIYCLSDCGVKRPAPPLWGLRRASPFRARQGTRAALRVVPWDDTIDDRGQTQRKERSPCHALSHTRRLARSPRSARRPARKCR